MTQKEMLSNYISFYCIKYKEKPDGESIIQKVQRIFIQSARLYDELAFTEYSDELIWRNAARLNNEFTLIRATPNGGTKPLCVYVVFPYDSNGAILGNFATSFHLYKIENYKNTHTVAPFLASSAEELFKILKTVKENYENNQIQIVDIHCHGTPQCLNLPLAIPEIIEDDPPLFTVESLKENQFENCVENANIILNACSTGYGPDSLGEVLAKKNPRKTIFAPQGDLFCSKPIISIDRLNNSPFVEQVLHGPARLIAHRAKKFQYLEEEKYPLTPPLIPPPITQTKNNKLEFLKHPNNNNLSKNYSTHSKKNK